MRAGDRVRLRAPAEILATLDERGLLEGLPFMPEMLGYFGRTFRVDAQVARACDTIGYTGVRRLQDTVLLDDLRCSGSAHGGCQAQCRVYWKEAWLRPASAGEADDEPASGEAFDELKLLVEANLHGPESRVDQRTFRCQATELLRASEPVGWWNVRSLVHEFTGGNVGLWRFVCGMTRLVAEEIGRRVRLLPASPFRHEEPIDQRPVAPAPRGLRPGELVQIRSKAEIRETLGPNGKNRGLWFDREMVPYCGRTARVKTKVERFIDEGTGRLVELSSDAYILDGVVCQGTRSEGRCFCPRAIYPWWRECWLHPLEQQPSEAAAPVPSPQLAATSNSSS